RPGHPDVRRLETQLSEKLGARVSVRPGSKKGAGKLVIDYHSHDELEGILDHIM
ncbi:MAG: chromosome partitioning protein ParB, partial [Pseudomonadota bacterium]